MAAAHHQTNVMSYSPKLRVVVDDVDEDRLHLKESRGSGHQGSGKGKEEGDSSWENPTARIKRIQVEAECRKMEFARLLEEHAQVIRTLKQMEEKEMSHLIPNSVASVTKA